MTHSENTNRIAKNTMFLYFRMFFTLIVALFTSRIILKNLGVEDYGIYNVVGGLVALFSSLTQSIASANYRFLTYAIGEGNKHKLKIVFSQSFIISIVIVIVIVALSETIGLWFLYHKMIIPADRFNAALLTFHFSITACIFMVLSSPYNSIIIAHENMDVFAYISIFDVTLKIIVAAAIVYSPIDTLVFYSFLICLISIFDFCIYKWYCNKRYSETKFSYIYDRHTLKEMLGFSGWTLFVGISNVSVTQGINLLLNTFFNPVVNAARGIAVQVQGAIDQFRGNLQTALNPQITKNYAAGNIQYMHQMMFASSKFSTLLLLFLSMPILIETKLVLHVWLNIVPDNTIKFIRLLVIISIIDCTSNPFVTAATSTNRIHIFQSVAGISQLMILPSAYIALRLYPYPSIVFIVHLALECVIVLLRIIMASRMVKLKLKDYLNKVVFRLTIYLLFSFIFNYALSAFEMTTLVQLTLYFIVCSLTNALLVYYIGMTTSERTFLKNKVVVLINKYRK